MSWKSSRGAVAVAAVVSVMAASPALASDDAEREPTIRVVGNARASAPPEIVTLQVAVVSERKTSRDAVTDNAQRSQAVLAALRNLLGDEAEIETLGFSLHPQYEHSSVSKPARTLRGYRVRNLVQVRTSQLDRIGGAIDAAAEAGSNEMQSLQFGLRNSEPLRLAALADATLEARRKAETIAAALGLEIARVVSVDESSVSIHQPRMQMARFAEDAATPIEPGGVELAAQVSMTVELAD